MESLHGQGNVATQDEMTLVNEFGQAPEGLDGKALQPLPGGEYFFSSEDTDEAWRVTLLCDDNVALVASGELAFEGQGGVGVEECRLRAQTPTSYPPWVGRGLHWARDGDGLA